MNTKSTFGQTTFPMAVSKTWWEAVVLPAYTIQRWNDFTDKGREQQYMLVCRNMQFADMQEVAIGKVHVYCIVDDFGNLVKAK